MKLIFINDLAEAGLAITKFAIIMNLAKSLNIEVNFTTKPTKIKDKVAKCWNLDE